VARFVHRFVLTVFSKKGKIMQRRAFNWALIETALALGVFVAQQTVAQAETATFTIQTDTTLDYKSQTTNYGSSTETDLYLNDYVATTAAFSGTKPGRGAISFKDSSGNSIVSLPTGAVVTSVTLSLWCVENWQSSATVLASTPKAMVYALTTAFTESGATWKTYDGTNAWTTAGGDYDSSVYAESGAANGNSWTTIDLTSIWSNADVQNNGLLLTFDPEDESVFSNAAGIGAFCKLFFSSAEAGSYAPYLTITYSAVPEPASIAMLGIGALGFVAYRRRKNKNASQLP
jgi:hypothetical protein